MRVLLPESLGARFNNVVAPFSTKIFVSDRFIELGRASFGCLFQLNFFLVTKPEGPSIEKIGSFCEFHRSASIFIGGGGEHIDNKRLRKCLNRAPLLECKRKLLLSKLIFE